MTDVQQPSAAVGSELSAGDAVRGQLALVGGAEWHRLCDFDGDLLAASGGREVLVLPTAAASSGEWAALAAVEAARRHFTRFGGVVRGLMVLGRQDAADAELVATARAASMLYVAGGSPTHLHRVLVDSPLLRAVAQAWQAGAVLAGSSAGAMVLCDVLLSPRGGQARTGLGLLGPLAVVPHANIWPSERVQAMAAQAPRTTPVALIDEQTALLRDATGVWSVAGAGGVRVRQAGVEVRMAHLDRIRPTPPDTLPHRGRSPSGSRQGT